LCARGNSLKTKKKSRAASGEKPSPAKSSENGIGVLNERSLHASLKEWYAEPGDVAEVKLDGYVIDLVRGERLIEFQTRNFSSIGRKLRTLVETYDLRLVHPVSQEKWIVRVDSSGEKVLSRRKSPRRGRLTDVFDELVRIPDLVNSPGFTLEVVLIQEEEVRCDDGKGSWRRKGVSITDRKLLEVVEQAEFKTSSDFLRFLPDSLKDPFTNRELHSAADVPMHRAQKMTYCLRKMNAIRQVGKKGNAHLYERALG